MSKQLLKKIIISLVAAALLTLLAVSGILDSFDLRLQDGLYQHEEAPDGLITVIGMDQQALDTFGPLPWDRQIYADAINYLNSDPENAPAAIGIDVLFNGASDNPASDRALAQAAAFGNVVVASVGTFGSELITEDGEFYMKERSILAWDQPYGELLRRGKTGHINAMPDSDGYIRHMMCAVDVPGIGKVKSMSRVIYETYLGREVELDIDSGEFFYLNYTQMPGAYYDYVSIADLVEHTVDSSAFAGRIVLIGPYSSGMQDQYVTSIDHAEPMFGIEIQANQIDALRAGFFPREAPSTPQYIILFILSFLLCFLLVGRNVLICAASWLVISGVWVGLCALMYGKGSVLDVLYIPLAASVIFIGMVAFNYFKSQQEKKHLADKFGKYVDPAIIKELLKQSDAEESLVGKSCDIAVLFVDIRGFTTMSESLPPEKVVEILNKYLTLTTNCIMRYHGTLDKFVGDCTMAFWNAPVEQEDPIYLACCAAMDMAEGSIPLGEELEKEFGRSVSFGVGVHYGPAVVGNIGAPQRMDYTAIGDTVNTASRLESNAPRGTIYISRIVADALGERAKTTSLGGTIKLKGKTEGFEVLTLDSLVR